MVQCLFAWVVAVSLSATMEWDVMGWAVRSNVFITCRELT